MKHISEFFEAALRHLLEPEEQQKSEPNIDACHADVTDVTPVTEDAE